MIIQSNAYAEKLSGKTDVALVWIKGRASIKGPNLIFSHNFFFGDNRQRKIIPMSAPFHLDRFQNGMV